MYESSKFFFFKTVPPLVWVSEYRRGFEHMLFRIPLVNARIFFKPYTAGTVDYVYLHQERLVRTGQVPLPVCLTCEGQYFDYANSDMKIHAIYQRRFLKAVLRHCDQRKGAF